MNKARRPAARTHAHEALVLRVSALNTFHADVARLALGVHRALRHGRRGILRVSLVEVIRFGAAASFNLLAELVVAAFFPVLHLARRGAVACLAAATLLGPRSGRGAAHALQFFMSSIAYAGGTSE